MRFLTSIIRSCCLKKPEEDEETPSPPPPPSEKADQLPTFGGGPAFEFTFAKVSSSSSFILTPAQAAEICNSRDIVPAVIEVPLENEGKMKYRRGKKQSKKKRRKLSEEELKAEDDSSV